MRRTQLVFLITLISCATFYTSYSTVTPYFSIRSQGLNTPRHMSGIVQQLFTSNDDPIAGTFSAALSYTRSFDHEDITQCLFGTKSCPTITISGSQVADRGTNDWLADYFYLPTDFKSSLSFKPIIDNILLDINFHIDLNEWVDGLYVAFYAPIVHSRWNLNMCETIDMKGTNSHVPGYFTPDTLQRNDLLNNFTEYAAGTVAGPITQTVGGDTFNITLSRLNNARMSQTSRNQTRAADLRVVIGYEAIRKDRLLFGFQGLIAGPTGNRPKGKYFFEPIIGNGHHWELGGAVQTNGVAWRSQDEEKQLILSANASLMHLFASRQHRTFDLKGKQFSRYMLIERLGTPIRDNLKGNGTAPSAQFRNEFTPVANLSNLSVEVSATLQAELTAMLTFASKKCSWDLGYNFWARSCENIKLRDVSAFENNSKWALKGDAHVFGFDRGAAGAGPLVGAVALSATENKATIESGTNFTSDYTVAQAILNPGIDNPQNATGDASGGASDNPLSAEPNDATLTIRTSVNPIFISATDIDTCEQRTRGLSSKVFTHFNYTWADQDRWIPYLGIGGEAEFAHNSDDYCDDTCNACISCALSQWGIWIKGGITF